jgi:hypothetical protein
VVKVDFKNLLFVIIDHLIRLHYYSPFFHRIGISINAMVFLCHFFHSIALLARVGYAIANKNRSGSR